MTSAFRVLLLLLALAAVGLPWTAHGQVRTEVPPATPVASPSPAVAPTMAPSPSPSPTDDVDPWPVPEPTPSPPQKPLPPRIRSGRIEVQALRLGNFRLQYHIRNGTRSHLTAICLLVPREAYDSRIMPLAPPGWVGRREEGRGAYAGSWVLSWFAAAPAYALRAGRTLTLEVMSGAPIVLVRKEGVMRFSSNLSEQLLFPWDEADTPIPVERPAELSPRYATEPLTYPRFSFAPPPEPARTFPEAIAREQAALQVWGGGRHQGEAFELTVRARVRFLGMVERGSLLLPSLPEFDRMLVGRTERLPLNQDDQATIRLRCFSISYGKRAPPPRLGLYDLVYRFATSEDERDQPNLQVYRDILARADRFTPDLLTPLGQDYPEMAIQWALWRKQRILEGRPLDIRDVERDLALNFRWVSRKRVYLDPLQVRDVARRVWRDTERLMYQELPEQPPL